MSKRAKLVPLLAALTALAAAACSAAGGAPPPEGLAAASTATATAEPPPGEEAGAPTNPPPDPGTDGGSTCPVDDCDSPTCGHSGEKCCPGASCFPGLQCQAGKCGGCGGEGEPCCGGEPCKDGLVCNSESKCETCGGKGGCDPGDVEVRDCDLSTIEGGHILLGVTMGVEIRMCEKACAWGPWRGCKKGSSGSSPSCSTGETEERACGACGKQNRTCGDDQHWDPWSACDGEGECTPGETDVFECLPCQSKVCRDDCTWSTECVGCSGCPSSEGKCTGGYSYGCMMQADHYAVKRGDTTGCTTADTYNWECAPLCGENITVCTAGQTYSYGVGLGSGGGACPAGYTLVKTTCSADCGECTAGDNAMECTRTATATPPAKP